MTDREIAEELERIRDHLFGALKCCERLRPEFPSTAVETWTHVLNRVNQEVRDEITGLYCYYAGKE